MRDTPKQVPAGQRNAAGSAPLEVHQTTRRFRTKRRLPLPPRDAGLDLLAWRAPTAKPARVLPRLLLLETARDPDGEPRPAVLFPGRLLPTVFPTRAAACAAIMHAMEARP